MRFMNIASGSKGNATYIGTDHTHILIDSGISRKRIQDGLKKLELSLEDLTAILVTHEHSDHISSLGLLERTREIPVYTTEGTGNALLQSGCLPEHFEMLHTVSKCTPFQIVDLQITAYPVSHDAADPVCYKIQSGQKGCAVVTDLGIWEDSLQKELIGLDAYLLEANHDVRMLETGPYPYPLKRRIAGNAGHLSNESASKLAVSLLHDDLKFLALGHLSQHNNRPDLAKMTLDWEIDTAENPYRAGDFPVEIADPKTGTAIYEF